MFKIQRNINDEKETLDEIKKAVGLASKSEHLTLKQKLKTISHLKKQYFSRVESYPSVRNELKSVIENIHHTYNSEQLIRSIEEDIRSHFKSRGIHMIKKGARAGSPVYKMLYHSIVTNKEGPIMTIGQHHDSKEFIKFAKHIYILEYSFWAIVKEIEEVKSLGQEVKLIEHYSQS
jgi:hypothetical protein